MNRLSFKLAQYAFVATCLIVPLLVGSIYIGTTRVLQTAVKEKQVDRVRTTMKRVDLALFHAYQGIQILSKHLLLMQLLDPPQEAHVFEPGFFDNIQEQIFGDQAHLTGPWEHLMVVNSEGVVVSAMDDLGVGSAIKNSIVYRQVFKDALAGKSAFSDAFQVGESRHKVVLFASPIFRRDELRAKASGVIIGHFSMAVVSQILTSVEARYPFYLLNKKGYVISASGRGGLGDFNIDKHRMHLSKLLASDVVSMSEIVKSDILEDQNVLTSYVRQQGLFGYSGSKWGLFLEVPVENVMAPVREVVLKLVAVIGVLALLVVISFYFVGRKLILPIQILTRDARRIAEGDHDHRIKLSGNDEVAMFAETFNDMLDKLHQANDTKSLAIRASNMGIWTWNITDDLLEWNLEMYHLYNRSSQDLTLTLDEWKKYIHHEDEPLFVERLTRAIEEREKFDISYRIVLIDGRCRHIRALAEVYYDESNTPIKVLGANWDITTEKQRELELERSNRELSSFAYAVSHDLKSPLRGIKQLAQWIQEDARNLPETVNKYLTAQQQRIQRMENMLTDILSYARAGDLSDSIVDVNTKKMCEDIIQLLDASDQHKKIFVGDFPIFQTLKAPLTQVFHNLLSNAIKHSDSDCCEITVSVEEKGEYFQFCISDNGPGIPKKYYQTIFKMFQTLRPRDEVEGSGLGLAMVKKIIENVGGQIWLRSRCSEDRQKEDLQLYQVPLPANSRPANSRTADVHQPVQQTGTSFYFLWPKVIYLET